VITLEQLQIQTALVLGLTFLLATLAGALFHRTHFCTMGAISDGVVMGDFTRARQWVLAVAVAALGFGVMAWQGLINPNNTIYAGQQLSWLSLLLGGAFFGSGMVLASGCVSKSLVRVGAGNLKSLVVLMAVGISALAAMRGLVAIWRVKSLDQVTVGTGAGPFVGQWLSSYTGLSQPLAWLLAAVLFAGLLCLWVFKDRQLLRWPNMAPGIGVGLVVVAFWWIAGVMGFVAEHPETLEPVFLGSASGRMEAISLTAPVALWWDALMYLSDGSKRLTLGMMTVLGLALGSFISAKHQGSFRWEGFTQTSDLTLHLLGGCLMGVGGVMALGCTVGQGLSGLSTLSLGSFVAISGIVLGAVVALNWQMRRAESV